MARLDLFHHNFPSPTLGLVVGIFAKNHGLLREFGLKGEESEELGQDVMV